MDKFLQCRKETTAWWARLLWATNWRWRSFRCYSERRRNSWNSLGLLASIVRPWTSFRCCSDSRRRCWNSLPSCSPIVHPLTTSLRYRSDSRRSSSLGWCAPIVRRNRILFHPFLLCIFQKCNTSRWKLKFQSKSCFEKRKTTYVISRSVAVSGWIFLANSFALIALEQIDFTFRP